MSFIEYALIGYLIGIVTTAPVGPVNVMAIQHAVHRGFREGVLVGFGAVIADVLYAAAALFGIAAVTKFVADQFYLIEIIGGLLLIIIGWKIYHTHPHLNGGDGPARGVLGDAMTAFFMTLTNPGVLAAYAAIFTMLGGLRPAHDAHFAALILVAGVAGGAASWWIFLSAAVSRYKDRIEDRWLDRANHYAGLALMAFGVLMYLKLAYDLLGL